MSDSLDHRAQEHGTSESVADYHIYRYEWIDFHDYEKPATDVLEGWSGAEDFLTAIMRRWLDLGWEGDGTITTIWIPPFCIENMDSTRGVIVWHVKQLEDGTSWIASKHPLPFLADCELFQEADDS